MDYAMNGPWWAQMSEDRPRGGERRRGRPGRRPGPFGPEGPFGVNGPFGPQGPFGPDGPFGESGPFGPMGPFGPRGHHRGGRARRGDVRQAILALLAEQPLNGYQIIQELADRTSGAWKPSPGAVYPSLNQLEDEGLVEQFDNAGQRAFRLTEAGQRAAKEAEKPWEAINAENAPRDPESARTLWQSFGDLAMAVKTVTRSGNAAQVTAASALLADTKRKLFGILANDGDVTANADDLR